MAISAEQMEIINKRNGAALNFIMAAAVAKMGGRVMRISWNEENSYLFSKNGLLLHNKPYHKYQRKIDGGYPYVLSPQDVYAHDWIVAL
jgi:hypothetical protein